MATTTKRSNPIPIRFSPDEEAQIRSVSEKLGLPQAQVIRMAVKLFLRLVKKEGKIPLDYEG